MCGVQETKESLATKNGRFEKTDRRLVVALGRKKMQLCQVDFWNPLLPRVGLMQCACFVSYSDEQEEGSNSMFGEKGSVPMVTRRQGSPQRVGVAKSDGDNTQEHGASFQTALSGRPRKFSISAVARQRFMFSVEHKDVEMLRRLLGTTLLEKADAGLTELVDGKMVGV